MLRDEPATSAFRDWLWSEHTDGRDAAADWLKLRSINLEEGRLRNVTLFVLALLKAGVSGTIKKVTGVHDDLIDTGIDVATDMALENAFGRVVRSLSEHNPLNFIDGLATVVGQRAIRSGNSWFVEPREEKPKESTR